MSQKLLFIFLLWLSVWSGLRAQSNALRFDGTNDYVDLPDMPTTYDFSKGFSFTAWVKWDAFNGNGRLFELTNGSGTTDNSIILRIENAGLLILQCANGTTNHEIRCDNVVVTTGKWYHVAATISSSGESNIYVNGAVVKSGTTSAPVNVKRVNNWLGKSAWYNDYYFCGTMDEVSFWHKTLSQSEINSAMESGLTGSESNLTAYYKFDQGSAGGANSAVTALTDKSANGFTGTLTNFGLNGVFSNWVEGYVNSNGPSLTVSEQAISLGCLSGSRKTVALSSNVDWTLTGSADWLGISQTKGTGNATLILTALTTNAESSARSVELVLTGKDVALPVTITVTQEASTPTVVINPAGDLVFENIKDNAVAFVIESNTEWSILSMPDWLKIHIASGNGTKMNRLTTLSDNPWGFTREGEVTLSVKGASNFTIKVVQKASSKYMEFSSTDVILGKLAGSTASIDINTNLKWSVKGATGKFKIEPMSGVGTTTIVFTALSENTTTGNIQEIVSILGQGIIITQKLSVNNLSASRTDLIFGSQKGSTATIDVTSDTDWHFEGHEGKFEIVPSSGTGNGSVTLISLNDATGYKNSSYEVLLRGTGADDVPLSFNQNSPYMPVGEGTQAAPYQIASFDNLQWMSKNIADDENDHAYYVMVNDIDAAASHQLREGFESIGIHARDGFNGSFDGGGFAISNLFTHNGLFSMVGENGRIQNLALTNVLVEGDGAGALVSLNDGTINGCSVSGNMIGKLLGMVFYSNSGTVTNCYATGCIQGSECAGLGYLNDDMADRNYAAVAMRDGSNYSAYINKSTGVGQGYYNQDVCPFGVFGIGLPTSAMKQSWNFISPSLDFENTWRINEGVSFPCLRGLYNYPILLARYNTTATKGTLYREELSVVAMDYPVASITLVKGPEGMILTGNRIDWIPQSGGRFEVVLAIADANGKVVNHTIYITVPLTGEGTVSNPYQITTIEELDFIRQNPSVCYELMNDLNFDATEFGKGNEGEGWLPIEAFYGTFYGSGHLIKNLYINRQDDAPAGLFGSIVNGFVFNLGLTGVSITSQGNTGAICGYMESSDIQQSYVSGKVTGLNNGTGGFVGECHNSHILDSYNMAIVTSGANVGGIAATTFGGEIKRCISVGSVSGGLNTGALAGVLMQGTLLEKCYFDNQTSTATAAYGYNESGAATATGLSTQMMKQKSSFADWNFATTWVIDEGKTYPALLSSKNNAPCAFGEEIKVSWRAGLAQILSNDYDYEQHQDNLIFKILRVEGPATVDEQSTYLLFNNDTFMGDAASVHYLVGELAAQGDTVWGNAAIARVERGTPMGPSAKHHQRTINEDEFIENLDLLEGAFNYNNDYFTVHSVDMPRNGTYTLNGSNLSYRPNPDFNGTDVFTYMITNGHDYSYAEITINVVAVNDAPVIHDALSKTIYMNENLTLTMSDVEATDAEGDAMHLIVLPGESYTVNGTTITPDHGFVGEMWVEVAVSDGQLNSNSVYLSVDVVVPTNVDEHETSMVSLCPNPCRDFVLAVTSLKIKRVSFINLAGQTLRVEDAPSGRINVASLQPGVYLVKIESVDGATKVLRLVKQ